MYKRQLFDVDNTLLDNDRVQTDLAAYLTKTFGVDACKLYWDIFERLRGELGYADYLGALERFRLEQMHDPRVLRMSCWLVDYPFADRLYAGALEAVKHVRQWGPAVILSDGDAVFQPRKVERSGLWAAFEDRVDVYKRQANYRFEARPCESKPPFEGGLPPVRRSSRNSLNARPDSLEPNRAWRSPMSPLFYLRLGRVEQIAIPFARMMERLTP